jgi:Dolichyl-phosphate-mannose-protein mannosyltransferase
VRESLLPFTPLVLVPAILKSVVQLAFADRYGWHIDELYYFASGHHPQLGYVDYPPIAPLLAGVAAHLFGDSLVGLRALSILAGAIAVVMSALVAREFGGGRFAQVAAATFAAASGLLLGANWLFQTVSFDQLLWVMIAWLAVRLLRTGDRRLWPALGVAAGVALETKYTAAGLLFALVVGFLLDRRGRALLRGGRFRLAIGVAVLLVLPNLFWQAQNGWPSVSFFIGESATLRAENSLGQYLFDFFVPLAGPLGAPLAVWGLVRLARDPQWRALAWASAIVFAGFPFIGGKAYYAAPILLLLFPAAAVGLERVTAVRTRWLRIWYPVAFVGLALVLLPVALPVLPEPQMVELGLTDVRKDYADEIGWPELVDQVDAIYHGLPPTVQSSAAILATTYGEAGALDLFGPARGLPRVAAGSSALTYAFWEPPTLGATTMITIGYSAPSLGRWCDSIVPEGVIANRWNIRNEERGRPLLLCHLRGTFADVWADLRKP